jgi:hypothetical protein
VNICKSYHPCHRLYRTSDEGVLNSRNQYAYLIAKSHLESPTLKLNEPLTLQASFTGTPHEKVETWIRLDLQRASHWTLPDSGMHQAEGISSAILRPQRYTVRISWPASVCLRFKSVPDMLVKVCSANALCLSCTRTSAPSVALSRCGYGSLQRI